jgi:DNA-binding XRE family transcriptional regulator
MRNDDWLLSPEVQAGLDAMGAELRQMRLAAEVTQRELEELAGMDQSTISRVERGLIPRLPLHRYVRLRAVLEGQFGPVRRHSDGRRRRVYQEWD